MLARCVVVVKAGFGEKCVCHESTLGLRLAFVKYITPNDYRDGDRDAFEELVKQWTGRDMAYHHEYGTTGMEFAWFCYQAGIAHGVLRSISSLGGKK